LVRIGYGIIRGRFNVEVEEELLINGEVLFCLDIFIGILLLF
jgi:hypothetical protein